MPPARTLLRLQTKRTRSCGGYAARHQNLPSIFWLGSVPPELLRVRTVTRARFEQEDQEWLARAREGAGRSGHGIMAILTAGPVLAEAIGAYREAWRSAGHPGQRRVMMTHNMYCGTSEEDVVATARDPFNGHLAALTSAARSWGEGLTSKDYPGYEKMLDGLSRNNFDRMREQGIAW
jgi:alkanesulfonate monooxygenase SsuD/methylene tetrahydromethanopterin reductase-like flavin-dependent oxidoreductase (luciferase family)